MQSETSATVTVINGFIIECNDGTPSRTTYSALNTLLSGLSYPFGNGDGSTTFNVPDLRGRGAWCAGSHADVDIGDSDGVAASSRTPKASAHTHTGPSHTHSFSGTTGTSSQTFNVSSGGATVNQSVHTHSFSGTTGSGGTGNTGSGGAYSGAFQVVGVMGVKF